LAARRLFAASKPIAGTLADTYLASRALHGYRNLPALRFHAACYHRDGKASSQWPALIAAITDAAGVITGVHRTWLARDGRDKAPLEDPRRALGHVLGHGVRLGTAGEVVAAGEGLETMLALRTAMPSLPCIAALSANHLSLIDVSPDVRILCIAVDNDAAGHAAAFRLAQRVTHARVLLLVSERDDWNADLIACGRAEIRSRLLAQLPPEVLRLITAGQ
jgi:hypothetical protein